MNLNNKTSPVKKEKENKLREVCFLCLSMCVHVLTGVPVFKRLRCTHVNSIQAMLVKKTCVVDLEPERLMFKFVQ